RAGHDSSRAAHGPRASARRPRRHVGGGPSWPRLTHRSRATQRTVRAGGARHAVLPAVARKRLLTTRSASARYRRSGGGRSPAAVPTASPTTSPMRHGSGSDDGRLLEPDRLPLAVFFDVDASEHDRSFQLSAADGSLRG